MPASAGAVLAGCAPEVVAQTILLRALDDLRLETGLDPELAVVLGTEPLGCDAIYYLPIANDARGIGYQHDDPREVFDDSPDSRLEGIVFLNDFRYWRSRPGEFALAWNHELGHRWGARVRVAAEGSAPEVLLGRARQHWSYFLDTAGSPLEGNEWTAAGADVWTADTPETGGTFSALDLYLMGAARPDEVGELPVVLPVLEGETDCRGAPLSPWSPPQSCGAMTLPGGQLSFTLDDVVRAEGVRVPAYAGGVASVDVAVFAFVSGGTFARADCDALESSLALRFSDFERASGGRVVLSNLTDQGASCADLPEVHAPAPPAPPLVLASGGCHLSAGHPAAPPLRVPFLALTVVLAARFRTGTGRALRWPARFAGRVSRHPSRTA